MSVDLRKLEKCYVYKGIFMRKKRLAYNTISSLVFQTTTVICGFILPRLILKSFGSEINGLVNSINQFLSIISFLELGVGAVVQSSLYKPLAEQDQKLVSKIIVSAGKFFKKLARILLIYIIILMIIYPYISNQNFGWIYTATLIAAMSISSFAQYYFGVVDRLFLTANQKGYIQYTAQTLTLIFNTVVCVILLQTGSSIHIVKLATSLIYLIRPICLRLYVNHHYQINRTIKYTGEPIKQKWNGVAQHVSAVVLDGTDNIVLTLFSTLTNVSIYSVYNLVIAGVKQMFLSMTNGFQALLGELWAKQELDELKHTFSWFEWIVHTGTVFVFGCTAILIVPFIQVYTSGITDAEYSQPLFALLIVTANAGHCLRLPYNVMILAGGHYKQTQKSYIIAVCINIVFSILSVRAWGLIGVAIGTLLAMMYQTIWMAWYDSKYLICWPIQNFIKQLLVDIVTVLFGLIISRIVVFSTVTYFGWIIFSLKILIIWISIIAGMNMIFYNDKIYDVGHKVLTKLKNRKGY